MTIHLASLTLLMIVEPAFGAVASHASTAHPSQQDPSARQVSALSELLQLPPQSLGSLPIARANLLCAAGTSGPESPSLGEAVNTVQLWAARVRSETDRHMYKFHADPSGFYNSEGFFRMLMLAVVLQEDFHVHYDESRKQAPLEAKSRDAFFSDPKKVFLHGLLGPERVGTCSSMPVLYVAIGREIGYPLKLVTTKGHLFVRWDGGGERFNVETTGHGLSKFDDDYYRHWPYTITAQEEAAEGYMKSLSAQEELAVFLSIRGMCFRDQGRFHQAAEAFSYAAKLAPHVRSYAQMARQLQQEAANKQTAQTSKQP